MMTWRDEHVHIPDPTHVASITSKSDSKKKKKTRGHAPFSARKHVGDDMSFHVVVSCHYDMSS